MSSESFRGEPLEEGPAVENDLKRPIENPEVKRSEAAFLEAEAKAPEKREEAKEQEGEQEPFQGFTVNDRRFWNLDEEAFRDEEDRPRLPSFVEQLQHRLEEKDKQLREYIAAYKSEVVEGMEKTKQRLERDSSQKIEQLKGRLAEPMMEVLDALERSIVAAESNPSVESMLQGIKMVCQLMLQKLTELGLSRIKTVGQPFDPAYHEAVGVLPVTDPSQDNIVVAELKPGFMMGDRLVRAALVQVGKLT